ncbi:MAG TPA: asparagine synthase (glutamine-hydrolyzing), partial [Sphingomicrobium sp.]|nr:asparagine synthase (glutamine-hydrolyzing) [Sphingomicrobium sp.]
EAAADRGLLSSMAGVLAHRGPDDEGIWVDDDCAIAFVHRRLSIVDLSAAGHQPMFSSDGRLVITFNGEIYNHLEIRAELEAAGAAPEGGWRGHSDTETLLEAVGRWGLRAALDRCVGMFAFGLWDRESRTLSLVRDRFGEKPLYYGWAGRDFVFASELKAIRCHRKFAGEIDRRALGTFTRRSYIPAPLSIYRGIFKLEPGCILEMPLAEARKPLSSPPSPTRYWSYRDTLLAGLADPIRDEQDAVDELDRALATAVRGQSIADVPVGAFLSGGIDSSSVVAQYQKYSSQPVRTFTIGFREDAFNEADYARAVAEHFGTRHFEKVVTARETQEVIPKLPTLYDEPFADSSQIPTYLVSAFAREQVTVALSGDGGDELFGGYNRYFATARVWSAARRLPWPIRSVAGRSLASVPAGAWAAIGTVVRRRRPPPFFGQRVRKTFGTIASGPGLDQVFTSFLDEWAGDGSAVLDAGPDPAECRFDLDAGAAAPDALRMMYCDAISYLPDDILCKVDRAAMGVSLETRVPFLDHRVASVAARIPLEMKIGGGAGKHVLRKLLYREAPRALFERPKAGFGIPVGDWLKGPLRDWAESLLEPRKLQSDGWFDSRLVRRRWNDHLTGARDGTQALWAILMFEAWRRDMVSLRAAA